MGGGDQAARRRDQDIHARERLAVQINISTRHGHISQETRSKIEEKVGKLTRLNDHISALGVTLDLEHPDDPKVELRVSVERAEEIVASDQAGTLWGSLDSVIHKAEQQLRKFKDKVKGQHHPGHRHTEVPPVDEPASDN